MEIIWLLCEDGELKQQSFLCDRSDVFDAKLFGRRRLSCGEV